MTKSELEELLAFQIKAADLPKPEREFMFAKPRRFRADFAWPDFKLLVEIDGGLYQSRSGHRSVKGVKRDMVKGNLAALQSYVYLRFNAEQIHDGSALDIIELVLRQQPQNALSMLWRTN